MKNILSIIILLCLGMMLGGCPYKTSVPIDKPSVKINEKLIGTWKKSDQDDEKYKITAKDEFTYSIEQHSKGSKDVQKYFAYESQVNGASFLNLYEENNMFGEATDESNREYYLYRIVISGDDIITLKEVTENVDEEFTTADELKKFIADNMNNSYFYTKDDVIYQRVGK